MHMCVYTYIYIYIYIYIGLGPARRALGRPRRPADELATAQFLLGFLVSANLRNTRSSRRRRECQSPQLSAKPRQERRAEEIICIYIYMYIYIYIYVCVYIYIYTHIYI